MNRAKQFQVHFYKKMHAVAEQIDQRSDFAKQEKFREILSRAAQEIQKLGE